MMNLRHLKLWKRSGSDVTSRRHHGNDDEDVIVVRAPSAAVDYDIRSPSSDSGYSDVVPASLMTSTTTTTAAAAGFGARHLQCQRNQQTIHEQQLHQHRIIRVTGGNRNLLPVHEVTDPSGGIGAASRRSQPLGAQGKRAMTSDALDTVLSSNAGSSGERKNPTRSAATGVFANTPPAKVRSASAGPGGARKVMSDGARPKKVLVAMDTFVGLIRDKNVERLRQVLADTKFDVNSTDLVGRTLLHHAVLQATIDKTNDLAIIKTLIQRGADVNIKDETNGRETALHIALRKRHLAAVEMILESPGFDVFKCGSLQRNRMLPELCLLDDMYQPPVPHLCRQPADASTSQNSRQQLRVNGDGQQAGFRNRSRDSDDTVVKSRSFGDQFILSCRQWNTFRRLVDLDLWPRFRRDADCEPVPVSDLVLIRDDRLPALGDVIRRLEAGTLARLYVVGCQLRDMESADWRLQLGRCMALRSLVLSHAQLRRIPDCVFDMSNLEVLIVDNNHLIDVPSTISRLSKLTTFVCDTQRPRLRRLPTASLARLQQLKVLSFSDNAFEAVEWTAVLCNLRVLRFSRNRVTRLPVQLVTMRQLTWLDVSYNPIGHIPHQLLELVAGPTLIRFDYRGLVHLRPPSVRGHVSELISHLRMESILASTCADDVVPGEDLSCDVTLALYGETGSGKSTLMRALKDQRGVCRDVASASSSRQAKIRPHQQLEIDRFVLDVGELLCTSPSSSSPSHRINHDRNCSSGDALRSNQLPSRRPLARRCNVTTFAFSGDYCDAYTRQLRPDIRLLLVDMTSLEQTGMGNVSSSSVGGFGLHTAGSHGRTATRTRIWLEALRELEPEVPVILVGTHADLVRSTSGFDALIDELFTPEVRLRHRLAMKSSTICSNCLLCETGSVVDSGDFDDRKTRQRAPSVSSVWPPALFKSRSSPVAVGRFDEMSIHFVNNDDQQHRQHQMPFNGHVTALTPDDVSINSPLPQPKSTYASEQNRKYPSSASLSSLQINSGPIFPHIVGCAVVDSVRNFPKSESKKSNVSVERLRGLIGRLAVAGGVACRVPSRWSALAKHLDSLGVNCGLATTPCIPVDDVICLARSYDVDSTEVPVLLHWLHRRARVVCFSDFSTNRSRDFLSQSRDENILYRYVAVDASWFANQLTKIATDVALTHGARLVDGYQAVRSALFADLGVVDLRDGGKAPNTVVSWLLSAAERLGILVRLGTAFSSKVGEASCSALHFLPDLLENGFPNRDAWPDRPEAVERQVTCDLVGLRVNEAVATTGYSSRFRLFAELLEALYSQPEVVSGGSKKRPLDVVFEPYPVVLATETVFYSALDTDGCLDCRQFRLSQRRNRLRSPHRMAGNTSEDDLFLDLEDFDLDSNEGVSDDVLHKLRISFDPEGPSNPFVRIQVRGPSPCCVMQAVIEFVEKYLDEPPLSKLPTATSGDDADDSDFRFQSTRATDGDGTTDAAATVSTLTPTDGMSCNGNAMAGGTGNGSDDLLPDSESLAGSAVDITAVDDYPPPPDDASFEETLSTPNVDEYDSCRVNFLLCPKCVLLGENSPERIPYSFARDALETLPAASQSGDRNARRCVRPVCSRWHNLGSWRRALMGDYRFGSFGGPGGSGAGGLGGIERPVYSLAPTTLPDYEHPRLLLLLPPSATEAERAWRTCGRARFLEGHDLHVLCENPTAWHMMDGRGLRLPSHLPGDPARKAEFSLRMLTVLDLSLTVVQLVQGANEHQQTCRLLSAVVVELLRTYDFLKAGAVSIGHNSLPGPTTSTQTARSAEFPRRTESELRREAELYLSSNRDRIATFLTRSLTSAAQQSAAADSSQQADIYLKAGGSASPEDVFGRGSGTSGPIGKASRTELGRFLRMETSPGRFGSLRSIYVGGELRWVCEKHYVELRSMPTIQLRL